MFHIQVGNRLYNSTDANEVRAAAEEFGWFAEEEKRSALYVWSIMQHQQPVMSNARAVPRVVCRTATRVDMHTKHSSMLLI